MLIICLSILGTAGAVLLAGFYAGMETASYRASEFRLRYLANKGNVKAGMVLGLFKNMPALVTLTLIGHNLAIYLATYLTEHLLHSCRLPYTELYATFILTPFCFIFAETVPKQLGYIFSEKYCLLAVRTMYLSKKIFWPLALLLSLIAKCLEKILQMRGSIVMPPNAREEFIARLGLDTGQGILNPTQHKIVSQILTMESSSVLSIMVPLIDLTTCDSRSSCKSVITLMRKSGYRKLPVFEEKKENITGMITLNNILQNYRNQSLPVSRLMTECISIAAETTIGSALLSLQSAQARLGIVRKNKQIIGMVTLNALLDEIIEIE